MSGIFGIIQRDGRPVDPADLERMRDAMAHRGPDGSNIWVSGSAGMGQLMLHSTPESLHETLPWQDPESGLVITADARIDNREELAAKLGKSALALAGARLAVGRQNGADILVPDSLFILEAYKRWREDCVDHLLGDFSFAIWDPREKRLFCARDPMGVRPFYYHEAAGLFVFASSAQAVAAVADVPDDINEDRVADFLVFELEGVDKECTFFRAVRRLPPATHAALASRGLVAFRFWEPDVETELRLDSVDDYVEAFRSVLDEAVLARLRSNAAPGAMLSGGIDSSTIVGLARERLATLGQPLRVFSGISDEGEDCRETRNIERVLSMGGLQPFRVRPADVASYETELVKAAARSEDPFDSHCVLFRVLYSAARAAGCTSMLDGLDGDGVASLTSIYPRYLVRDGLWLTASREIRGLHVNYYQGGSSLWRDYFGAVKPMLAPRWWWQHRCRQTSARDARALLRSAHLSPQLAQRVDLVSRISAKHAQLGVGLLKTLRHAQAVRIQAPFLTVAVERYGRLAAGCGMEARHPLLDRRVVEFCLSLPWDLKARDGWTKYALRRVAEQVAPREVAWRRGWDAISWKFMWEWERRRTQWICRRLLEWLPRNTHFVDERSVRAKLDAAAAHAALAKQELFVFYLLEWLETGRE